MATLFAAGRSRVAFGEGANKRRTAEQSLADLPIAIGKGRSLLQQLLRIGMTRCIDIGTSEQTGDQRNVPLDFVGSRHAERTFQYLDRPLLAGRCQQQGAFVGVYQQLIRSVPMPVGDRAGFSIAVEAAGAVAQVFRNARQITEEDHRWQDEGRGGPLLATLAAGMQDVGHQHLARLFQIARVPQRLPEREAALTMPTLSPSASMIFRADRLSSMAPADRPNGTAWTPRLM